MSLSPEIRKIPQLIGQLRKNSLVSELISGAFGGQTNRDLITDARRGLEAFSEETPIALTGLENFPQEGGCLLVFNHPNVETLVPAILALFVGLNDTRGRDKIAIVTGSEIPLFKKFIRAVPGSIAFMKRFHGLYPDNIISLPTLETRRDYERGRLSACRKILGFLKRGGVIAIAPEGHVEKNNTIAPLETCASGPATLAIMARNGSFHVVPVGIWEGSDSVINISIGNPFNVSGSGRAEALEELMGKIALLLPNHLRGQFQSGGDNIASPSKY